MNIEELMHDIVDQPAPPSGLEAEAIYNAGRRRRRRRTHRTYGGLLVATVVASAGIVGANAQNFNAAPSAPASDTSSASVDTDTSADASAGADAEVDTDGDVSADAEVDADVDTSADAGADAQADVSAGADADASIEATAPTVPELPALDCDEIAATVQAELAAHGLGAASEAQVSCHDGTVDVVVAGTVAADPALTDLTVQVALVEAATIEDVVCAGAASCEHTAAGVLASTTGGIALGRTDGLVVRIHAQADQSVELPGDIDQAISTAQLRDLTLALGESLPTP